MLAENAYLFRHALVRDAAYQLLLPERRAELHRSAIDAIEQMYPEYEPFALELADHAAAAQELRDAVTRNLAELKRLAECEVRYLRIAAGVAERSYNLEEAIRIWDRLAAHPALSPKEKYQAIGESIATRNTFGRHLDSERVLRDAIEQARTDGLAEETSRLQLHLGVTLFTTGRIRDAHEVFGELTSRADLPDDPGWNARLHLSLAGLKTLESRHEEAKAAYEKTIRFAQEAGEHKLLVAATYNMGTHFHHTGELGKASDWYRKAHKLADQHDNYAMKASSLVALAIALYQQGESAPALRELEKAIAIARETRDRHQLASALTNYASLLADPETCEESQKFHEEALQLHREAGNVWGATASLMGLGTYYTNKREFEKARSLLTEAIELAVRNDSTEREGVALQKLAIVELEREKFEDARTRWRRGRELLEHSRDHREALRETMEELCRAKGIPSLDAADAD